jgi:hypothetical protein
LTSVSPRAEVGRDVRALLPLQVAREPIDADDMVWASVAREIYFARLNAAPAALRCIECQGACTRGTA